MMQIQVWRYIRHRGERQTNTSPGDDILRIENNGLPNFVKLRGTTKRYRLGKWNGLFVGGGPRFPIAMYNNVLVVFRQDRMISA